MKKLLKHLDSQHVASDFTDNVMARIALVRLEKQWKLALMRGCLLGISLILAFGSLGLLLADLFTGEFFTWFALGMEHNILFDGELALGIWEKFPVVSVVLFVAATVFFVRMLSRFVSMNPFALSHS